MRYDDDDDDDDSDDDGDIDDDDGDDSDDDDDNHHHSIPVLSSTLPDCNMDWKYWFFLRRAWSHVTMNSSARIVSRDKDKTISQWLSHSSYTSSVRDVNYCSGW